MDHCWEIACLEARARIEAEPLLTAFLRASLLDRAGWRDGMANHLAIRLARSAHPHEPVRDLLASAFEHDPRIGDAMARDLRATNERDPACDAMHVPLLFYKGFHALQVHRAAHWHWRAGHRTSALMLQHHCSIALAVDIHPAARFGSGILLDHGTGFVAGETAVVGDDVNLLHGVTLGGTGKESGDRHPKVRDRASIGAGALILGNVVIGEDARVGAGSVVLDAVPAAQTAAGTRARIMQRRQPLQPAPTG